MPEREKHFRKEKKYRIKSRKIKKYGIRALYSEIRNLIEIPVSEKIFENTSENNNFLISLSGERTKVLNVLNSENQLIENNI